MADLIQKTDSLNDGRVKLNEAIKDADTAKVTSKGADVKATEALAQSTSTQTQLDTIVIDGDSSVEAAQARVGVDDTAHTTLKHRLDAEMGEVTTQLAETTNEIFNTQLTNKTTARPSITITDDDGRPKVYTLLKQLALEYNIPITSGVITGRIDVDDSVHISKAQMKELQEIGFEFVSHTKTHPYLATLSEAQIEEELKGSSEWLNKNGFDGHSTIIYPYGSINPTVLKVARKYYKSGFDIPINGGSVVTPILKQFAIQRVAYNSTDGTYDTANIKAKIDESLTNNGWTIVMTHAGYDNFTIAGLREIVEYAKSKGVEIITVKEGLNRFGNLIDVSSGEGGATVGADGQIGGGFRNEIGNSFIKVGTPITDYPTGLSVTYLLNDHPARTDFPLSVGGSLETYRAANTAYSYQKYITYTTKESFYRHWNISTGKWDAWMGGNKPHTSPLSVNTINGWTNSVDVSKTLDGQVWLRGILTAGTVATGTLIATMPSGFSIGNYSTYFTAYNHTQNKAVANGIQIFGRDIRLRTSEVATGDSIRFGVYFQSTEN